MYTMYYEEGIHRKCYQRKVATLAKNMLDLPTNYIAWWVHIP